MPKRSRKNQSAHDKKVAQIARKYERDGWKVEADIPRYKQPSNIARRRPDIKASRPGTTHIIEVETPDTMKQDRNQHSTFRRHAAQKPRTKFKIEETK